MYLDESGISHYLHRPYGRSLKGQKVIGEVSGHRFLRQSFISALFNRRLTATLCFQGTCDTLLFNTWLKNILLPELKTESVIILDNASFHRSEETKKILKEAGHQLLFLPPYSPDFNPIEKYWANLKVKIRNLLPKFNKITDAIDAAFVSM